MTRNLIINTRDRGKKGMREFLSEYVGARIDFIGKVSQFGEPKIRWNLPLAEFCDRNVLITNIYSPMHHIHIEHVWLPFTDEMRILQIAEGNTILFTAKIVAYQKRLIDDYTLRDPQNIRVRNKFIFQLN